MAADSLGGQMSGERSKIVSNRNVCGNALQESTDVLGSFTVTNEPPITLFFGHILVEDDDVVGARWPRRLER